MDLRSLMDKHKKPLFREITDWSSSHNELRFKKDWWAMKTKLFFFFHPLGYKYFLFGVNLVGSIFFTTGAVILFIKESVFIGVFLAIVAIFMVKATILKIKSWKVTSHITFYDLLMRET